MAENDLLKPLELLLNDDQGIGAGVGGDTAVRRLALRAAILRGALLPLPQAQTALERDSSSSANPRLNGVIASRVIRRLALAGTRLGVAYARRQTPEAARRAWGRQANFLRALTPESAEA